MQFIKLELDGFGKFADTTTIDFDKELNFIHGMNESGKSTILEGIMASIFKYTYSQIAPFRCWNNFDACKLSLTYKNDDGEIFRIKSDYKNNRRKLEKYTKNDFVEVTSAEKNISPYVKKHFGFDDKKVFENTAFIKQSQMVILEDPATKSKIKDMIEEVLAGRAEVTATKTIKKLRSHAKDITKEISKLEPQSIQLETDLQNANEINSRITTQSTDHDKISKELEEKIETLKKLTRNKELFDKKESLSKEKQTLNEKVNDIDSFIIKLKDKQIQPAAVQAKYESKIIPVGKAVSVILLLLGICISIGSFVLSFPIGLIFGVPLIIYGLYKLIQKKGQIQKPPEPSSPDTAHLDIAQYDRDKRTLINKIAVLDSRLDEYKLVNFTIDDFDGLEELKKQVEGLKEKKIELKTRVSTTTSLVESPEEVQEKLDVLKAEIEELQNKLREHEYAAQFLELAQTAVQKKFTPIIEKDSKHILKEVTNNHYEEMKIDEKTLDISINSPEKNDYVDVARLSEGARDQIYFTLRTVLVNLLCGSLNIPLILDDPFHNFDEIRLEKTIDAIKNISKEKQIILISHRPYHDVFDNFATKIIELE